MNRFTKKITIQNQLVRELFDQIHTSREDIFGAEYDLAYATIIDLMFNRLNDVASNNSEATCLDDLIKILDNGSALDLARFLFGDDILVEIAATMGDHVTNSYLEPGDEE